MLNKTIAMVSVAGLALVLSGCSSTASDSGIAKIGDATVASAAPVAASGTDEEQALAFAQCMRDNGVDFPDPTVDADGSPSFEGALGRGQDGAFDPTDTSFRDAMTACSDLMDGLQIGPGSGTVDQDAMSEALYSYTQCLRDEGLDVGDITLDSQRPGGGQGAAAGTGTDATPPTAAPAGGQPDAPAQGVRGGGTDSSDRFAEQLGQDTTDPAWIAANETCQPVLTEAMTAAGVGPRSAGA